jgi:hypothetical protein
MIKLSVYIYLALHHCFLSIEMVTLPECGFIVEKGLFSEMEVSHR